MNIVPDITKSNTVSNAEVEQVQQEEKEYFLLGTFLRTRGLTLFYYNPANEELKEATVKYSDTIHLYLINGEFKTRDWESQKTTVDSRVIYFEVLNKKTAIKRVQRWKDGRIKELCNLRVPSKDGIKFF